MFEPISEEEFASNIKALIERIRNRPTRDGKPHKTFDDLCKEQGVDPIDVDKLMAKSPGPLYEGFERDIKIMRRGGRPLGPCR
jgi:hypothetical protein